MSTEGHGTGGASGRPTGTRIPMTTERATRGALRLMENVILGLTGVIIIPIGVILGLSLGVSLVILVLLEVAGLYDTRKIFGDVSDYDALDGHMGGYY